MEEELAGATGLDLDVKSGGTDHMISFTESFER